MAERIPGITTDAAPPSLAKVLAPGSVVAERYRLDARLGSGGGGTVWSCHDQELATTVALKIVTTDGDLERWRREVAMARRIADRHVCRVHDLGEAGDLRFVTMELVAGDSLRTKIAPTLDAAIARDLFTQIVAGVSAIHAAGVVHRDLKPENIVVGDGRAVIVDFGLAREPATATSAPSVTQSGAVVGTPRYMAPEQAVGLTADARSDVWALGLVGHELLTGTLPVLAEGGLRVAPEVERKWPGIAPVLLRCLALEPADRFADARALAAALGELSPRRRTRRIALVVGGLGVVAIGGLVIAGVSASSTKTSSSGSAGSARASTSGSAGSASAAISSLVLEPLGPAPKRWPQDAPSSVVLSRDGKRYATTTVAAEQLFVRALDDTRPDTADVRPLPKDLVTTRAVGWFGDDSIAILATTREGTYELHRVDQAGQAALVHRAPLRFVAAIGPNDQIAIGHAEGVWLLGAGGPTPLATAIPHETIHALAWSPDGSRLAVARVRERDASIQIMTTAGVTTPRDVWTGDSLGPDLLLAWLDDHRVAFTTQPGLIVVDTAPAKPTSVRAALPELVGPGSAAAGTLLVLRTSATDSVQVGDDNAEDLAPAIANIASTRLTGWTTDGRLVFAAGSPPRIVRAKPGTSYEPWPGTLAGVEVPDSVLGDSVVAHRVDPMDRRVVVELIDATGKKREMLRLDADRAVATPVRCAGDRAAPCMLYELAGSLATWTELDTETGQRGRLIHTRGGGTERHDAALSPDGSILAIVEGTPELTIYDRPTGSSRSYRATDDTAFDSLGFSPTGDVWATSLGFRGRRFGLVSFSKYKSKPSYFSPSGKGSAYRDALRRFTRPTVSPDGKRVAVEVRELRVIVARVRGL